MRQELVAVLARSVVVLQEPTPRRALLAWADGKERQAQVMQAWNCSEIFGRGRGVGGC